MGNYHVAIPFVDWRRRRDEAEYCDHDFGVLTKTSPAAADVESPVRSVQRTRIVRDGVNLCAVLGVLDLGVAMQDAYAAVQADPADAEKARIISAPPQAGEDARADRPCMSRTMRSMLRLGVKTLGFPHPEWYTGPHASLRGMSMTAMTMTAMCFLGDFDRETRCHVARISPSTEKRYERTTRELCRGVFAKGICSSIQCFGGALYLRHAPLDQRARATLSSCKTSRHRSVTWRSTLGYSDPHRAPSRSFGGSVTLLQLY